MEARPIGTLFASVFHRPPKLTARAHGRVNLIGEHTDYNDGFVLPYPIPQFCEVEVAPRADDQVVVFSREQHDHARFVSYELGRERARGAWCDYIQGVTHALRRAGHGIRGFDAYVRSSVPIGAGLSSSAALEVAFIDALAPLFDLHIDRLELARIAQRAETDFVGAPIGIMDQMSASMGRPGFALFLDTRTLANRLVRLPSDLELVVIDSGIAHAHRDGEYRTRRTECDRAARLLAVDKLRDLHRSDLDRVNRLSAPLDRRVRHVVTENARVLAALEALEGGELDRFGELLNESHRSLRDDFEVSIPPMDQLIEIALREPGVFGARMTGGGFGGAAVVSVKKGSGERIARSTMRAYREQTGRRGSIVVPQLE
jgi:galactokinase